MISKFDFIHLNLNKQALISLKKTADYYLFSDLYINETFLTHTNWPIKFKHIQNKHKILNILIVCFVPLKIPYFRHFQTTFDD